jgi:hypothetical protein
MNKSTLLLILALYTPILSTDIFQYVADGIEDTLGIYHPNNVSLFTQFKTQLEHIQQQLSATLKEGSSVSPTATTQALRKQHAAILMSAQKVLDPHDYYILQHISKKQVTVFDTLLQNWQTISAFWQTYALGTLQKAANQSNIFRNSTATVTQRITLHPDEAAYIAQRMPIAQQAIAQFVGNTALSQINIGYIAPGGGYRALILTSGYLRALEELGLLNGILYSSALSGSTWFQIPWLFSSLSIADFQHTLLTKILNKQFNPTVTPFSSTGIPATSYIQFLVESVWPKFLFNQQLSSVDVYGSLLAYTLLPPAQQHLALTDQWELIKKNNRPFPLYNAVSLYTDTQGQQNYFWNEFTPLQMRNLDLNLAIPTYAFGSEFDKDKSLSIAPQQLLGYLMGIFGSAYLIDLVDINKILTEIRTAAHAAGHLGAMQYLITATLINLINLVPISYRQMRLLPSLTNNPLKNSTFTQIPSTVKSADKLIFADAGIVCNIPGRPLLDPRRNLNVLIIGDTSGDTPFAQQTPNELRKLLADAERIYGYRYTQVDDKSAPTLRLYKDLKNAQAPRIIYFNFEPDQTLLKKGMEDPSLITLIKEANLNAFDYNCISIESYCTIFNFEYSSAQFKQLSGIAQFNILANKTTIQNFLQNEFKKQP